MRTAFLSMVTSLLVAQAASAYYGDQIPTGSSELTTTIKQLGLVTEIDGVRWDAGSSETAFDDVVAFDLDRSGAFSLYDVVIADGAGSRAAGTVLRAADVDLLGRGTPIQLAIVYADVQENGFYGLEDLVYATTGGAGNLPSTSSSAVSIRMTNSTHGLPGSFVRTPDADRIRWTSSVTNDLGLGAGNASIAYHEIDGSNRFEGMNEETIYLSRGNVTNTSLPAFSLRLYGALPPAGSSGGGSSPTNQTTSNSTTVAPPEPNVIAVPAPPATPPAMPPATPPATPPAKAKENQFVPAPAGLLAIAVATALRRRA